MAQKTLHDLDSPHITPWLGVYIENKKRPKLMLGDGMETKSFSFFLNPQVESLKEPCLLQ
jgi:hypothetical protein